MKIILCSVLCSALCLAQSPEPIKFRGVYIGQPLNDFMVCPGKKARDPEYKTHGKLCEEGSGSLSQRKLHRSWGGMASEMSQDIVYTSSAAYDGIDVQFSGGAVDLIIIRTPKQGDWNELLADLVQKLGRPDEEQPTVFQNGFGARWEFPLVGWRKGDVLITAGVDAHRDTTDKDRIEVSGTRVVINRASARKKILE